jgi:transposase-like protein
MIGGFVMAGKKGMQHYSYEFQEEITNLHEQGLTYGEIQVRFGFSTSEAVRSIIRRFRAKANEVSLPPKKRGRPRKTPISKQHEIELELNRLKMENELLRAFLFETGRWDVKEQSIE